jgi:molybdate transport system ATP-binding protein
MTTPAHRTIGSRGLSASITYESGNGFTLRAAFEAHSGFTMLLGPSGSGKTTLLNCIAGLARPRAGRIVLDDRAMFDSDRNIDVAPRLRRIGYVFQDVALFPHLSVQKNIEYGIASIPATRRRELYVQAVESMGIAHLAARKPSEISGGERQRAALARSMVTEPALLLLDEPLTALDLATKSKIIADLRQWNSTRGIPVICVTHSPAEARALGDRVVVLESGAIVAQGVPHDVMSTPRHETVAQVVGFENVFEASVASIHEAQGTMTCRLDDGAVEIEVPLGRAVEGARVRIAIRAGDIMLATSRPEGISARNSFEGKIASLRREGAMVVAIVAAGAEFEVHLTPGAVDNLGLAAGRTVWVVIKTHSCNLVAPASVAR